MISTGGREADELERKRQTTGSMDPPIERDARSWRCDEGQAGRPSDPESPPTHWGARFRPAADRFHPAKSRPARPTNILPTHSPLTTRVEIPILRAAAVFRPRSSKRWASGQRLNGSTADGGSSCYEIVVPRYPTCMPAVVLA